MRSLLHAALACAALAAAGPAAAQTFPTKPIRMVVTFPTGGAPDTLARTISDQLFARRENPL
jgi:tripartite-type tricarboxylate transporter receptor subunit TctC